MTAIPVTLQFPVQTSDGNAWLFRREIELPCLFPGMGLSGWGLPRVLDPTTSVCTQVGEITVVENGKVYVTVYGSKELQYTKEQVLRQLGKGWRLAPTGIPFAEPGEDAGEDLGGG